MELRKALGIFRIEGRVSMEQLNATFRELVKKYHPDKVRDYSDWANERMSEINAAYERLTEWITAPRPEPARKPKQKEPPGNRSSFTPQDILRRETTALTEHGQRLFYPLFNTLLDGLGIYYQYGLEKINYKEEGVRRFRLREAGRHVQKARSGLEALAKEEPHPAFKASARFARLSLASMNMGVPIFTDGPPKAASLDSRFRQARKELDMVIKEYLFPEMVPAHLRGRSAALLYSSYAEFVLYLTAFPAGERQKAAILQTARYDSFMDLLELRNEGIINF